MVNWQTNWPTDWPTAWHADQPINQQINTQPDRETNTQAQTDRKISKKKDISAFLILNVLWPRIYWSWMISDVFMIELTPVSAVRQKHITFIICESGSYLSSSSLAVL